MPVRGDRLAIAVLAREIDVTGDARQPLDHRTADHAGVPGRAAGHDLDARESAHPLLVEHDAVEIDLTFVFEHARADRVADRARLLEDLLLHEAVVDALLGLHRIPLDQLARALHGRSGESRDHDTSAGHHRELRVLQDLHLARVRQDRSDVRGDEVLSAAQPHDDRVPTVLRDHDFFRRLLVHDRDRVGALEPAEGRTHGVGQRLTGLAPVEHQVGDDLGVGLRTEDGTACDELVAQRAKVLDDAVPDHRDGPRHVRVGVALARLAVGCPARVSDAERAGERHVAQRALEVHELALGADHAELRALEDRDAGGIVTAVLQAPQAVHDHVLRAVTVSDVADDSTHLSLPP